MTTLTFDTHDFVKKLKGVGFSEEQAELITDLQKTTMLNTLEQAKHDYELEDLATKRDLKELELGLELKISEIKADLIRWIVGVGLLQITIITALMLRLVGKT
ncbi:MAG: coiled-coil domain-containing protein [Methylococcales bacterium]